MHEERRDSERLQGSNGQGGICAGRQGRSGHAGEVRALSDPSPEATVAEDGRGRCRGVCYKSVTNHQARTPEPWSLNRATVDGDGRIDVEQLVHHAEEDPHPFIIGFNKGEVSRPTSRKALALRSFSWYEIPVWNLHSTCRS